MSASNVRPVAIPGSSGSVFSSTNGNVTFYGAAVRNTDGTNAVVVNVRAGNSASGDILASYHPGANSVGSNDWFGPQGINAGSGIYVEISGTGTALGSVFVG